MIQVEIYTGIATISHIFLFSKTRRRIHSPSGIVISSLSISYKPCINLSATLVSSSRGACTTKKRKEDVRGDSGEPVLTLRVHVSSHLVSCTRAPHLALGKHVCGTHRPLPFLTAQMVHVHWHSTAPPLPKSYIRERMLRVSALWPRMIASTMGSASVCI
jgi:hypothetical protein